jgi:hypothetical protein
LLDHRVGEGVERPSPSVGRIDGNIHRAGVPEMTPEPLAELRGSVGVWVERQLGVRVGGVFFSRVSMSRVWGVLLGDGRRVVVKVLGCWFAC